METRHDVHMRDTTKHRCSKLSSIIIKCTKICFQILHGSRNACDRGWATGEATLDLG